MGKFSKHIGQGETVKIDGEEFVLQPLGIEYAGHFLMIGKGFSGSTGEGDIEGMFKNYTDETFECIKEVVLATLKESYPDEPEEDTNVFAGKHLMQLLPIITKLNSGSTDEVKGRAKEKIEALQRLHAKKDGPSTTDQQ